MCGPRWSPYATEDAYANEVNFGETIKGFYGSLDDSFGNDVGGAILDRFMSAVQEIADARGMLLSNVEADLCQRYGKRRGGFFFCFFLFFFSSNLQHSLSHQRL